jgi:hypothetical protein
MKRSMSKYLRKRQILLKDLSSFAQEIIGTFRAGVQEREKNWGYSIVSTLPWSLVV